jgi:hypothetical protein
VRRTDADKCSRRGPIGSLTVVIATGIATVRRHLTRSAHCNPWAGALAGLVSCHTTSRLGHTLVRCATAARIRVATRPPDHLCPESGRSGPDMPGGQRRQGTGPVRCRVPSIPHAWHGLRRRADADCAGHHLPPAGQSGGRGVHGPSHSDAAGLHPPPPDRVDPAGRRLRQPGSRQRRSCSRPTAGPGQRPVPPPVGR